MKQLYSLILLCACMASTSVFAAASISTYPMRIELEEGESVGKLVVMNSADAPVTVQVRAVKWDQGGASGEELQVDSKDLVFFPKIFTIPAKGEQTVRVGHSGKLSGKELSYRMLVRELPIDEPGQIGARFALQISLPAFVYPKGATQPTKPALKGIEVFNGTLSARVNNEGERYFSMPKLEVLGKQAGKDIYSKDVTGWYVLAGASKLFPLKVSRKECMAMDSVRLIGHTKEDQSEATFPLDKALCRQIAEAKQAK